MPMDENKDVNKEVVQPKPEGDSAASTDSSVSESSQKDDQERNWKEVREIMQKQRHEITELQQQVDKEREPKEKELDPLSQLADDDILTVADAKKLASKIAKQTTQEIVSEYQKRAAIENVPSQHSDYNDVIKYVDEIVKENPALETAILNSPNPRLTAYQLVKSSYLYKSKRVQDEVSPDARRALDNTKKPLSSQSVGTSSPLSEIRNYERMSPERAAEVRKLADEYASKR